MEDILSKQELYGAPVQVETFEGLDDQALRAVAWAKDAGVVMFPPFYSYPGIGTQAARDLRNFARHGFERSGTVVFVGGGLEIKVMNDVFGFEIHPTYVKGPYYKDERYAREDSTFGELPDMIPEVGNVFGAKMSTLPPNSRSFYDSFGVSVACCVRVGLGRACFLAQDFMDVVRDEIGPWATLLEALINYQ
uniref:Uncharacterized protein n=1 Tax=Hemiselmis andersenii TaxID=464988 RepID=A0A7S1HHM0_HEMAN